MRKGGGGPKGGAFERKIAKALSLWLTYEKDQTQLIRSVSSGGWKSRKKNQAGDLAPNGKIGERFRRYYAIECKHHKSIRIDHLFTRTRGECLHTWWDTLIKECKRFKCAPILIYRANGCPIMVATSLDVARPCRGLLVNHIVARVHGQKMVIFPFEDLLQLPPEHFLHMSKCDDRNHDHHRL